MVEEQSLNDRGVKDVDKLWNNMEWIVLRRYNLKETKTSICALFLYFSFPESRWRKEFGMVKDPHWILLELEAVELVRFAIRCQFSVKCARNHLVLYTGLLVY